MLSVEIDEAQKRLAELIQKLAVGTEILITRNGRLVARLLPPQDRVPGSAKGLFVVPDDFDAPLDDFREHM